ncbi:MAG: DinB family protein [Armatimonadetes bacterium]|nr:DinB family protein [Armatimonadota bacterium]
MSSPESASAQLIQVTDRLLNLLERTPDDRLTFRPSETSRSILEIVAHCSEAMVNILSQMKGTPFHIPTSKEADAVFRVNNRTTLSREQAVSDLLSARQAILDYYACVTESELDKIVALPFGLGDVPARAFLDAPHLHTTGHVSQIEYIQTIFGDHDWHMGF